MNKEFLLSPGVWKWYITDINTLEILSDIYRLDIEKSAKILIDIPVDLKDRPNTMIRINRIR